MPAAYRLLHDSGELARRADRARELLADCRLCPRDCGVDRLEGGTGFCGVGSRARVASFTPHFGEEGVLVGRGGSGTIFFSGCNLGCVFCQNHEISRDPESGLAASPEELAGVMLDLVRQGCANINLVTPSHVVPQILAALPIAVDHGLDLPLVYNTGGFDCIDTLRLLDGVVDVYMPDVKIWDPDHARRHLRVADYPERARRAVAEMHRQVGDLRVDGQGLAVRGLLVRHLVLPGGLSGTGEWMRFLAGLSRTAVNLMDLYHPCAEAGSLPPLDRMLTAGEFERASDEADRYGLVRLDRRDRGSLRRLLGL